MTDTTVGQVKIADDVILQIASAAVLETEGVANISGTLSNVAGKLRGKKGKKGVSLRMENDIAKVSVDVIVTSGVKIQEVARNVQQRVKTAIETMTGLNSVEVRVNIIGLVA
ncbi:MAG: Asp23/Gls24 family envelope stress response protein [Turicibacter sp.]|nr:Asp23/Gls24 family envelope stress response protein [Turicibacter sp.]